MHYGKSGVLRVIPLFFIVGRTEITPKDWIANQKVTVMIAWYYLYAYIY